MAVPEVPDFDAEMLTTTDLNALGECVAFLLAKPIAQMRQTVSQNITTSTFTAITFTTEDVDTEDGHSTSSNNSRYTAVEEAWYWVKGAVAFESNATGRRLARWTKNGTEINGSRHELATVNGGESIIPARPILVSLSAGDYVELQGWQSSGGTRATSVTADIQSTMTVSFDRTI